MSDCQVHLARAKLPCAPPPAKVKCCPKLNPKHPFLKVPHSAVKQGKVPPPGPQFAAPYGALVNLHFFTAIFFFAPHFFCRPLTGFAAPDIFFCQSAVAHSEGFMLLYNIFVSRPLLIWTVVCPYIIFCPSTVDKLDINLPIL